MIYAKISLYCQLSTNIEENYNELSLGKAASSHDHDASAITSGTLDVARGGTGVNTIAAFLQSMFPDSATPTYIPVFGSSWEYRGFTTPASLRTAMGAQPISLGGTGATKASAARNNLGLTEYFRAYYLSGSTNEITALKANWSSIDVGAFLIYMNLSGTYYGFVGMKLNANYGALIQLSYGSGAIYKYRLNGGTWYEHAHTV